MYHEGREGVGLCSQVAVFTRDSSDDRDEVTMGTPYITASVSGTCSFCIVH